MLRLTSDIQIGDFKFTAVNEVEIDSSWDNLTDTCTVKFPRKVAWQGRALASGKDAILTRNMPIVVKLGYDDNLTEVFGGIVRDIGVDTPVSVKCEDQMFTLKSGEFNGSYRSVKLSTLMADLIGDLVPYEVVADMELGAFRVSKATPAKVLEYLREHYFVRAWFREGTLYVGLPYVPKLQRRRIIRFEKNVISSTLEWRERDSVSLLLKAVIMKPDNTKTEVEVGDKSGEVRTFHYYNISPDEAKNRLSAEAERLRYTGYRGTFTTFGKPDIRHGDIVRLSDKKYPERDGSYLVKRVKITFGINGYRQEVELESKV